MIADHRVELDSWVRSRFGVELRTDSSPIGRELTDLVGLALRRNPRRAHLLVSTVLGKHIPVDPRIVRDAGRLLGLLVAREIGAATFTDVQITALATDPAGALRARSGVPGASPAIAVDPGRAAVFGFAETATGLGHCVAEALQATWYLHSTRRLIAEVPVSARFEEGHSHATSHLVQPSPPSLLATDQVLVLVDDELSTGSTAMSAIGDLHAVAPRSRYVLAALIDLRSADDAAALQAFAAELGCEISVVALVSGRVELPAGLAAAASAFIAEQSTAAEPAQLPGSITRIELPWPAGLPEGGRHGLLHSEFAAFDEAVSTATAALDRVLPATAQRVLVIGTEELMYLPMRIGAALADRPDRETRFQTTTRSPVHPEVADGYPVNRAFSFPSPEGATDVPRHLYNADWRGPDGRAQAGLEPDVIVVIADRAMDGPAMHAADGLLASLAGTGAPVVLGVIPGCDPTLLASQ